MSYYCEFCNYKTPDSGNFSHHKKTKKHILNFKEKSIVVKENIITVIKDLSVNIPKLSCSYCNSCFTQKSNLSRHKKKCKENNQNNKNIEQIIKDKEIIELKLKLEFEKEKSELYKKIENEKTKQLNLAMNQANIKINKLIDDNRNLIDTVFYLDNNNLEDCNNIDNTDNLDKPNLEKPKTLVLNNITIVSRITDNYINATQLCKAGNKKFNHWITLDSTKELISVLATDTGITASELVELNKGGNYKNQDSWIHPDLAIQLAQWLSPKFALQVSKWIRTLFSDGKVEVSLKLLKDKEKELNIKDKKIKLLENLHVKKQKRENYPEKYVIYIVTTKENKNNRIYIIGKAKELKNRLSTYNKSAEHEVIYYKGCKNEEDMNAIETMVLTKLKDYKEKANRDRFILPENKDISFFTNIIDNSIKFFE